MLTTNYYASIPPEIKFAKTEEEKSKYYYKIMKAPDGSYTNALYLTFKKLVSIIKFQRPDYIAVVLDKTRDTFRRKIYPQYKANRTDTPLPLNQQFNSIEKMLRFLGIPVFISDDYEADDLAGTISAKFQNNPIIKNVYLLTKDHDYFQLVSEKTKVWLMMTDDKLQEIETKYNIDKTDQNLPSRVFEMTENLVKLEEGILPYQQVDKKALVGDKSDNIPGVKGISDNVASILISYYGNIENMYKDLFERDKKDLIDFYKNTLKISRSPYNSLIKESDPAVPGSLSAYESAKISKELSTIVKNIDMKITLDDLSYKFDILKYKEVCAQYAFNIEL